MRWREKKWGAVMLVLKRWVGLNLVFLTIEFPNELVLQKPSCYCYL